jgi:hypothetical protein
MLYRDGFKSDRQKQEWIIKTMNQFVNVLRARLRKWYEEAGAHRCDDHRSCFTSLATARGSPAGYTTFGRRQGRRRPPSCGRRSRAAVAIVVVHDAPSAGMDNAVNDPEILNVCPSEGAARHSRDQPLRNLSISPVANLSPPKISLNDRRSSPTILISSTSRGCAGI